MDTAGMGTPVIRDMVQYYSRVEYNLELFTKKDKTSKYGT